MKRRSEAMRSVAYGSLPSQAPQRRTGSTGDLAGLLCERSIIDLAPEVMERRDAHRANGSIERPAAQQSDLIARKRAAAEPGAKDQADQRALVAVDAEQREVARVTGGDVPEFAADHKREFVVFERFDPVARDHQRIRLAETERGDRYVVILANEDQRHRNIEGRARALDDFKDAWVLSLVNAHAGAQEFSAGERDVDHRDDDEQRDLRRTDGFVKDVADEQCGRQRAQCRQPEGYAL